MLGALALGLESLKPCSLKAVILINEPELKITYNKTIAKESWSEGLLGREGCCTHHHHGDDGVGSKSPFGRLLRFDY